MKPTGILRTASAFGLALVLLTTSTAGAKPSDEAKCYKKRLKLVSKAISQQLGCSGKAALRAEEADPACLSKARTKFEAGWIRNDEKSNCTSEEAVLGGNLAGLIDDTVQQIGGGGGLGPSAPPPGYRLVFFAPFCDEVTPEFSDGVSELAWAMNKMSQGCMPRLDSPVIFDFPGGASVAAGIDAGKMHGLCSTIVQTAEMPTLMTPFEINNMKWDAWISTSSSSPETRFNKGLGNYVLRSGTIVAHGWADLVDGTLTHAIDEDINGNSTFTQAIITGTKADGTAADGSTGTHCSDWTDTVSGAVVAAGSTQSTTQWSDGAPSGRVCRRDVGSAPADDWGTSGVVCVAQTSLAALPGPTKSVFVTSTRHTGHLGGIAGADAICQARADEAGLGGTFMAWIASDAASDPESRFTMPGGPWFVVQSNYMGALPVAESFADLANVGSIGSNFHLVHDEYGAHVQYSGDLSGSWHADDEVWTGNVQANGTYIGGGTCLGWTVDEPPFGSTYLGHAGHIAYINSTHDWTSWGTGIDCRTEARLYCFEQ